MHKFILGIVLCIFSFNVNSSIWVENNAGDNLNDAESITELTSLTEIHGSLGITSSLDNADVYRFQILTTTEAENNPSLRISSLIDTHNGWQPNLWLFDSMGNGMKGVQNYSSSNTHINLHWLSPGEYLLGVSVQGVTPRGIHEEYGDGAEIFDPYGNPYPTVHSLTDFGGSWSAPKLEYQLSITGVGAIPLGVGVSPVPIPAALWLFGSGLIGLIGFARRIKCGG